MALEQTKQMSKMMGHIADMMQQLAGMVDDGMRNADTQQQRVSMRARMTEMQQRLMGMRAQSH